MLFVKIWHYIRGYVIIKIEGIYLEKFINLVHCNNILIWDINKVNTRSMFAKIELKDIKNIYSIAEKLSLDVSLYRREGMTLLKWRVKTRKLFAIGSILAILFIICISSFVITIDIVGNKKIISEEIMEILYKNKLKPGAFKGKIDVDLIEYQFLEQYKEIEYINIEFHGTKAIIKIVERKDTVQIYDKSIPINIVAERDGIIQDMLVINGIASVKIGQQVKSGDLLISSCVTIGEGDLEQSYYVHAMGKIIARTTFIENYDIDKIKIIDPDAYIEKKILHIGNISIKLNNEKVENQVIKESSATENYNIFGIRTPVKIENIKSYDVQNSLIKTEIELEEEVLKKAKEQNKEFPDFLSYEIIKLGETDTTIKYQIKFEVLKNIAQEQRLNEGGI